MGDANLQDVILAGGAYKYHVVIDSRSPMMTMVTTKDLKHTI
jgi:serine protease inhibitor ecotin